MRLKGWSRVFFVYSLFSALVCFVIASEQTREMRIKFSSDQSALMKMIEADSKVLPCVPSTDGIGCGQEMSLFTRTSLEALKKAEGELAVALPKFFLLYFVGSLFVAYLTFQIGMFIRRGFEHKKAE